MSKLAPHNLVVQASSGRHSGATSSAFDFAKHVDDAKVEGMCQEVGFLDKDLDEVVENIAPGSPKLSRKNKSKHCFATRTPPEHQLRASLPTFPKM